MTGKELDYYYDMPQRHDNKNGFARTLKRFNRFLPLIPTFMYLAVCLEILFNLLIVTPYALIYRPLWQVYVHSFIFFYASFNCLYHYTKCVYTKPIQIYNDAHTPSCATCQKYKPPDAHHCQLCDTCIVGMDHHCIWIGQCVGAHNHRYFFQVLVFQVINTANTVIFGIPAVYYGLYIVLSQEKSVRPIVVTPFVTENETEASPPLFIVFLLGSELQKKLETISWNQRIQKFCHQDSVTFESYHIL
ncbi:unnamed protein product [Bursaphelenchus okinawaensis]|uniref:Palmitoyltransferase n=1 Tax=Bursaphelenchus okinawaensis TaxID=465554 RepID=A0A811KK17_9BILA|nr:unnamed protein product [Bursaphelenchus okinawaensis]CAG9105297.1 unnamed protein product [Bursaphelenchus okinawaensis]